MISGTGKSVLVAKMSKKVYAKACKTGKPLSILNEQMQVPSGNIIENMGLIKLPYEVRRNNSFSRCPMGHVLKERLKKFGRMI